MLATIREFALDLLEASGDADDAPRRHAGYFVELAARAQPGLRGPEEAAWLRWLARELDNFRSALAWLAESGLYELELKLALDLSWFAETRALFREGQESLEAALSRPIAVSPDHAEAFAQASILAFRRGDYACAKSHAERGIQVSRELQYPRGLSRSMRMLAAVLEAEGALGEARKLVEESLAVARAVGEDIRVGGTLLSLAVIAIAELDYDAAEAALREAHAHYEAAGWPLASAMVEANLALVALGRGRLDDAVEHVARGVAFARERASVDHLAYAVNTLAAILAQRGDAERAARLAGCAEAAFESIGAVREPTERSVHERPVALLREQLPEERFAAAWAEGRALHLEAALDDALAVARRGATETR
jgi:tetratricopeptide (TPR) repeat protein